MVFSAWKIKEDLSVKLGFCNDALDFIWVKGDDGIRSPSILGKHRKALKFINAAPTKYSKNADLHKVLLDAENKKIKTKIKQMIKT